jgi:type IV secretion system protein VirB10
MVETNHHFESENDSTKPSRLLDRRPTPEGVISKQSQAYVMAGLAVLILFAVLFSKSRQRTVTPAVASSSTYAAPSEINERKIQDLKEELNKAQRTSEQEAHPPSAPNTPATPNAGSAPPTPPPPTPDVQRDPIVDAEKQIAFKSRFASNLISSDAPQAAPQLGLQSLAPQSSAPRSVPAGDSFNPLVQKALQLGLTGDKPTLPEKRPVEVNVNAANGQPYVLFEGTTIDTTLLNRLNGDFAGPVKVMVTNPVYSHDRQHVLVPEGTFLLGDAQKVDHFGQKRLAVSFHRMIMPDGYSIDLDKFHGLSQIGETGLTDQINNHYLEIFGVSIAVGLITGAADATTNTSAVNLSNSDAIKESAAASIAQSASHVLDRFLNILPTITIREGLRIKIYLTEDLLLPAYENHAVPPAI